jgi:uncharacterized protein YpmS
LKIHKKTKFKKKLYLILIVSVVVAAVVIIVFALLLHRPAYYKPLHFNNSKEVSVYLTHELLPELYNGAQLQEPFNLVVTQDGINDIVARFKWPQEFGSIRFSAPMVFFSPDSIVLMGIVSLEGAEFVVTVIAEPNIDAAGLLNLQVVKVKIGAVDITLLAGVLAKRICQQRFDDKDVDTKDLWNKMIVSLVNGEPFEPVFKVEDKRVRVEKITIEQKKLTIRLIPVFD